MINRLDSLSPDTRKDFERYVALVTRLTILEKYRFEFKEYFDDIPDIISDLSKNDKDAVNALGGLKNTGAVGLLVVDDWIEEIKKERDELHKKICIAIYNLDVQEYFNLFYDKFFKALENDMPDSLAKEFIRSIGMENDYAFTKDHMVKFIEFIYNSKDTIIKATSDGIV